MSQERTTGHFTNPIFKICLTSLLSLSFEGVGLFTNYQQKNDQPIRDKLFAIAHEIGHWVLHSRDKERPRINFHGNEELDKTLVEEEKEANSFAFELLMPYEETRNLIIFGYSVNYIASHFGVPIEAAYRRYNEIHQMIY